LLPSFQERLFAHLLLGRTEWVEGAAAGFALSPKLRLQGPALGTDLGQPAGGVVL
jgi:hypothetical protein